MCLLNLFQNLRKKLIMVKYWYGKVCMRRYSTIYLVEYDIEVQVDEYFDEFDSIEDQLEAIRRGYVKP